MYLDTIICDMPRTVLWRRETLTNPHFNSFDKINFDELLDIAPLLDIIKALIWVAILIG